MLRSMALALGASLLLVGVARAGDNQTPIGFHDGYGGSVAGSQCFAVGWAVDPDERSARLDVRVSADGNVLGTTTADVFRPDLVEAGISDGYSGFAYDLRGGQIALDTPHEILTEARDAQTGEWQALGGTPRRITCADSPPQGTHDAAEGRVRSGDCRAAGWAIDPDHPLTRLDVRIFVDGSVVATTVADQFRQDLLEAGISDGYASFDVDLTILVIPGRPHEVRVQAQDPVTEVWADLNLTPKTLQCLPAPPDGSGSP